jgi:hypothetical protein
MVLVTMLALVACHDAGTAPQLTTSLRVVEGGTATDTILAMAPTPLVVEVRDSTGALRAGTDVVFTALPVAAPPGGNGRRGVYVCPVTQLTLVNTDGTGRRVVASVTGNNGVARPTWTPAGDILFEQSLLGSDPSLQVIDTLGVRHGSLDSTFSMGMEAAFSTAPAALYFYGKPSQSGPTGIYEAATDGSAPVFLVAGFAPAPSPHGSRMAFVKSIGGVYSLVVLDSLNGAAHAIAPDVLAPHWSPAGDWIGFISAGQDTVTFVHPDGTGRHTIEYRFLDPSELSWSPDGVWAVVANDSGGLMILRASDGLRIPIPGTGDLLQASWR